MKNESVKKYKMNNFHYAICFSLYDHKSNYKFKFKNFSNQLNCFIVWIIFSNPDEKVPLLLIFLIEKDIWNTSWHQNPDKFCNDV